VTGFIFQLVRIRKLTDLSLIEFAKPFGYGLLLSLIIPLIWLLTHPFVQLSRPTANILLGTLGCALAYAFWAFAFLRNHEKVAF
jgi:hypothetical protein